jgi:hypothetical protein
VWWVLAACALGAIGAALAAALSPAARGKAGAPGGLRAAALALALASVLAIPVWAAVRAVEHNASDTNRLGVLAPSVLRPLSSYLRAHQGSAYYETVYDSASKMGELVVHDARPVLVLNTANSAVVTPLSRLKREIARGRVRYAVISEICGPGVSRENSDCSIAARWIVAHGRNISAQAGLPNPTLLWLLPHVQAATARASASATAPSPRRAHTARSRRHR